MSMLRTEPLLPKMKRGCVPSEFIDNAPNYLVGCVFQKRIFNFCRKYFFLREIKCNFLTQGRPRTRGHFDGKA